MPTYEYACDACGHKFEEFQSIKAKPVSVCPVCKKRKVKRLISAGGGFIFKGSGFYITDYRSEGYKAAAKSDAAGGSGGAGTDAGSGGTATKTDAGKKEGGGVKTEAAKSEAKAAASAPAPAAPAKASSSAKKSAK